MRRATLLVADRNPRFLEKTGEILAEAGHTMVSATDGQTARVRLSKELDGMLVHAALPGLSGFALCRLAKERDPTLPVVIMFSAEDERGEVEARRAGADNWLVRPLKPLSMLLASLDSAPTAGDRDILAAAARSAIRDIDIPVAFGESDVLVVMPHTDLEGARLVAERIRKRVRTASNSRPNSRGQANMTASIGVVTAAGGERLTFATLLAQATRAQKSASRAGGDRIVIA